MLCFSFRCLCPQLSWVVTTWRHNFVELKVGRVFWIHCSFPRPCTSHRLAHWSFFMFVGGIAHGTCHLLQEQGRGLGLHCSFPPPCTSHVLVCWSVVDACGQQIAWYIPFVPGPFFLKTSSCNSEGPGSTAWPGPMHLAQPRSRPYIYIYIYENRSCTYVAFVYSNYDVGIGSCVLAVLINSLLVYVTHDSI